MLQIGRSLVRSQLGFFIDIKSFRSHCGPGVDSSSYRNEYREYILGVKSGRCVKLTTYHHPVPLSRNLGTLTSWNPLGLSRPVMGLLYLFTFTLKYTRIRRIQIANWEGCVLISWESERYVIPQWSKRFPRNFLVRHVCVVSVVCVGSSTKIQKNVHN